MTEFRHPRNLVLHHQRKTGGRINRSDRFQSHPPLISVITVVYNMVHSIGRTIQSVSSQTSACAEYIVIDGGSVDGTIDVLKSHDNTIDLWISEHDKGIYDAMNKGVAVARGEWVYFLGGDDTLAEATTLETVVKHLQKLSDEVICFGDVLYENGHQFRSSLNWRIEIRNSVHHQGTFYKRSLFNRFSYDIDLSVLADYELNYRIYNEKLAYNRIDQVIALCANYGQSDRANWKNYRQEITIRNKFMPPFRAVFFNIMTFVRFFLKKTIQCTR